MGSYMRNPGATFSSRGGQEIQGRLGSKADRVEIDKGRFTEAALRYRNASFVIDGEAVRLGMEGISDFDGLHGRKQNGEVQFYAFDILVGDGEDLRGLPPEHAQGYLSRLLARGMSGKPARFSQRKKPRKR